MNITPEQLTDLLRASSNVALGFIAMIFIGFIIWVDYTERNKWLPELVAETKQMRLILQRECRVAEER